VGRVLAGAHRQSASKLAAYDSSSGKRERAPCLQQPIGSASRLAAFDKRDIRLD